MLTLSERPQFFREVIGQDVVKASLLNQSREGRFFQTQIFSGLHGSGKTTSARILAKAVNCENPDDGEPCGCCASCRAITDGSSLDVIEIDGASNNGVDKVRELIGQVQFRPVAAKKKVYIIDEVHMLSTGAFNALLKTLEEPPQWCVFILCTTEFEKIPETVRSRSACYSFSSIPSKSLFEHLRRIADKYGREIEEEALNAIVGHSGGSARDAIRDMETCFEAAGHEVVTMETAGKVLGIDTVEQNLRFISALAGNNVKIVMETVGRWFSEGKNITNVLAQELECLTDIVLYRTAGMVSGNSLSLISSYAEDVSQDTAYYLIDEMLRMRENCRRETNRSVITSEFVKMAAHTDRLSRLEKRIEALEASRDEVHVAKNGCYSLF